MKIFDDIQQQPPHIRELFMWLMVAIVFSFVLYIGFSPTARSLTSALQPGGAQGEEVSKEDDEDVTASLFGDLRASIGDFFENFDRDSDTQNDVGVPEQRVVPLQELPI